MPPFPPGTAWIGDEPADAERIAASGPVLVHFLDAAQLNCVRSLPYVLEWRRRYEPAGLRVVGIHTARYGLTGDPGAAAECLAALGAEHPVAIDAELRAWRDYGCKGWPSLFLFCKGGALRWYHLGEGAYDETERAIQGELNAARDDDAPAKEWPEPVEPIRASDHPGATVIPPSGEIFPGGSADEPFRANGDSPAIAARYTGGGVAATVAGEGEIALRLDGEPTGPVQVGGPGLIELVTHPGSEEHGIELTPAPGVEVWSISFAPGVPG